LYGIVIMVFGAFIISVGLAFTKVGVFLR